VNLKGEVIEPFNNALSFVGSSTAFIPPIWSFEKLNRSTSPQNL
jgi:hypothetical protein